MSIVAEDGGRPLVVCVATDLASSEMDFSPSTAGLWLMFQSVTPARRVLGQRLVAPDSACQASRWRCLCEAARVGARCISAHRVLSSHSRGRR